MTLKPARSGMTVRVAGDMVARRRGSAAPYGFLVRALYFVLVGWWFSALWLLTAWSLLGITFSVALPLAFWMFNRVGAVTTLRRL
jgi:hypothetical protein